MSELAPALALVLAAVAAFAPAPAGAQDPRLDRRLDVPTRTVVSRLVDSARAAGLPTEALVDKALEGASKRASSELIERAVRLMAAELARARALLGTDASANEIEAGARALRAGVSAPVLQQFRRERGRRPATVALAVLGELVARGVPPDTAARAVLALTARGAGDEELVAYQRGVERGVQIGAPPAPLGGTRIVDDGGGGTGGGLGGVPLNQPTTAGAAPPRKPAGKPPRP